jgi:hypothetical protein
MDRGENAGMKNACPISYPRLVPLGLPGFEVDATVERMMGRADMWWRVLEIFHIQFCDWPTRWHQSQALHEDERKAVHALRSAAANIGAVRLAAAAAALENTLMSAACPAPSLTSLREQLYECFDEAYDSATWALFEMPQPTGEMP